MFGSALKVEQIDGHMEKQKMETEMETEMEAEIEMENWNGNSCMVVSNHWTGLLTYLYYLF